MYKPRRRKVNINNKTMKKKLISIALIAVLTGMSVSCQKETYFEPSTPIIGNCESHIIQYTVNGERHSATIHNDFEEHALIQEFTVLAFNGFEVVAYDEAAYSQALPTKDTQKFTTSDKEKAAAWCVEMIKDGYKVTVDFDEKSGQYICLATK